MKAKEEFKSKAELAAELDSLGIEYAKIKSGASEGKPTQSVNDLYSLYASSFNATQAVVFRKNPRRVNPMTFR